MPRHPPPRDASGPRHARAAILQAAGLRKTFGSGHTAVQALRGIDVTVYTGEFTAIMGPSGSGKSTLMHCLAGLDTATAGQIWLGDTELTRLDDHELTMLRRQRVGFVFQSFNLLPVLDARANMLLPLRLAGRKPDRAWADILVRQLGLTDRMDHRPHELSGGQQQRLAIARALLPRPDVVFADEPTGNLDSASGGKVLSLLRSVVNATGQTVVMVTHDPAAAAYADRVLLFADGDVAGELHEPDVETVAAGLRALGA